MREVELRARLAVGFLNPPQLISVTLGKSLLEFTSL